MHTRDTFGLTTRRNIHVAQQMTCFMFRHMFIANRTRDNVVKYLHCKHVRSSCMMLGHHPLIMYWLDRVLEMTVRKKCGQVMRLKDSNRPKAHSQPTPDITVVSMPTPVRWTASRAGAFPGKYACVTFYKRPTTCPSLLPSLLDDFVSFTSSDQRLWNTPRRISRCRTPSRQQQ
jgi:hypothetical protein